LNINFSSLSYLENIHRGGVILFLSDGCIYIWLNGLNQKLWYVDSVITSHIISLKIIRILSTNTAINHYTPYNYIIEKTIAGYSIFFLYKENLWIMKMFLLTTNHDNENVDFTKSVRKIKYLYPAQKKCMLK